MTSQTLTVAYDETASADFDGIALRTAAVSGAVTIERTGLEGVTVSLTGEGADLSVVTNAAGQWTFTRLHAGSYAVGISGFDTDEYGFDETSANVTVALKKTATVDFDGIMLRTVEIMGTVTTDREPLAGVTVTISGGRADETVIATTDMKGSYSVGRLHAGDYTVTISGFDTDEYEFEPTSQPIMAELGAMVPVSFPGVKLRTVEIFGAVAVEGEPLADVTVTVSGGRANETVIATTDAAGAYSLDRLHAGDYTVAISEYDGDEFKFDPAEQSVTVVLGEMREVLFEHGIPLRTASISGRITIGGDPAEDITITLSGEQEAEMETTANGQYNFPGLPAGDYTLELSGFDTEEYEYTPESLDVTLMLGEGMIQNFAGRSLRTVVITGAVTAEGEMITGANASLYRVITLTEIVPVVDGTQLTDEMGEFIFDDLLDDTYAVVITRYDAEYDFPKIPLAGQEFVAWSGYVATDDTAMANFTGTIIRTAMVGGEVTADGDPIMDIEVMIEGEHAPDDNTMMTDADGMYMFDGLRKGDYTISIANPDAEMYDFPTMERDINVAVGQVQDDVSFAGSVLREASISGQVHVEGHALEDVTVMLSGDADGETTTDANGQYNFPRLAGGDYTVSITNPDADRYTFEVTEVAVDELDSDDGRIVDFRATHVHEASISGMLFLDEVAKNGDRDDGEPVFDGSAATMAKLILEDEDGSTLRTSANSTGAYEFKGLKAGTYTLKHDKTSDGDLYNAGYAFAGDSAGVSVELTGPSEETVDLPYEIVKQTLNIGAVMANRSVTTTTGVAGVAFEVYPNLKAAQEGNDVLGSGTTAASGVAAVTFARADDYGPGGPGTESDGVVIVGIDADGSSYHDDLAMVEPTGLFEAVFAFTERTADTNGAIKLVNTASQFKWRVMSAEREVGGEPLEGWTVSVRGINTPPTGTDGYAEMAPAEVGIAVADIPKRYTVTLDTEGQPDATGEEWESSGTLSYTHTGLDLPGAAVADIGTISVNWTTQSLYFGFYREVDGQPGFTNEWVGGGDVSVDHRPVGDHLEDDVSWTFRSPDGGGRYVTFEWDHDGDPDTEDVGADDAAEWVSDWVVRFPRIPTDTELKISLTDIGEHKSHYLGDEVMDAFDLTNVTGVFNTFGADGGGHPEMWLCGESSGDNDDCVTHGYQWKNGWVDGEFWPRHYDGYPHSENENLGEDMTVTLEGVSPTANVDSSIATDKDFEWGEVNDGVYILRTAETGRYELDSASYSYSGGQHGEGEEVDANSYLDTLYVFYQERDDGQRDEGVYDRETIFKVSDRNLLGSDATLKNLTVDGETVPGFAAGDPDGSSYEMTVGGDRGSIVIAAAATDEHASVSGDIGTKSLTAGERTGFTVTGTAEDGITTAGYTIVIYRTGIDATLKNLTVDGDDVPGFSPGDPGGNSYDLTVGWDVDSVLIAATATDDHASVSGGIGWLFLKSEGRTTTSTVTGTAEDGETKATYTINIYRTTDRVKIKKIVQLTPGEKDTVMVTANDTVKVMEGDTLAVELVVSLWAAPTDGNNVTVEFRDSTWTFTSTDYDSTYEMFHGGRSDPPVSEDLEDEDGEDEDSTYTITATGGDTGHEGDGTFHVKFVDNDVKQFVGPTEISAIGGVTADDGDGNDFRTAVVTTLGTRPMAGDPLVDEAVTLNIYPTSGGGADVRSLDIDAADWDTGATFNVFGDVDGDDFDIEVGARGGGYDGVNYPDIAVNWVDSADYQLVVQTQAANIVPERADSTRVILWKRQATDVNNVLILDDAVVFDTLDLVRGCPEEWTCQFSVGGNIVTTADVSLGQTRFEMNVVVTAPDGVGAGSYTVRFEAYESDDTNDNGYFIGGAEQEYVIRFTVLDTEK
ncbi:MAG: carboxypeptidase regulatory-like domain-containing protein [Gemmatimonadetes bacterium]|nr:carboxypeptidase regulatory-like domain-containing protein [Gemmatimonadota bacterium]